MFRITSTVTPLKLAIGALAWGLAAQASAQVTFYERENYGGRAFALSSGLGDFERAGFNDKASSVIVARGQWEVCEDRRYEGRCVVLRQGAYDSLASLGLNNRISSVRPVSAGDRYENEAPEPIALPTYDYRVRPNERIYEARVTSVRAVVGSPTERCWVERQPARPGPRGDVNVGGAVVGALIGGILGHQVGGGTGRDIATAGGVIAGATIGANTGREDRDRGEYSQRDVRRCETTPSTTPTYWDVSYTFRGTPHQVQMSAAPGPTIAVNRKGEPRG